jgi:hypothetical protein
LLSGREKPLTHFVTIELEFLLSPTAPTCQFRAEARTGYTKKYGWESAPFPRSIRLPGVENRQIELTRAQPKSPTRGFWIKNNAIRLIFSAWIGFIAPFPATPAE